MLLIDTYNLYHTSYAQYGRMLDYDRLIQYLQTKYRDTFLTRYGYVSQTEQSRTFVSFLRSRHFIIRSKLIRENKLDSFDVELTLDAVALAATAANNDTAGVVICSSSLNLLPLVRWLSDEGRTVSIHSCGIPYAFREHCIAQELPIDVMRQTPVLGEASV